MLGGGDCSFSQLYLLFLTLIWTYSIFLPLFSIFFTSLRFFHSFFFGYLISNVFRFCFHVGFIIFRLFFELAFANFVFVWIFSVFSVFFLVGFYFLRRPRFAFFSANIYHSTWQPVMLQLSHLCFQGFPHPFS